jgi:hypothetical protein
LDSQTAPAGVSSAGTTSSVVNSSTIAIGYYSAALA